MIYQCTKDLLKQLGKEAEKKPDIYNPLFAWQVKMLKTGKRKMMYLMNDASKLSLVLYGVTTKELKALDPIILVSLAKILEDCGINKRIIECYLKDTGSDVFTGSGTRKQLGTINRAYLEAQYMLDMYFEDSLLQRQLSYKMNEGIYKNDEGTYIKPKDVIGNLLRSAYTYERPDFDISEIALYMFDSDRLGFTPYIDREKGTVFIVMDDESADEDIEYDDRYIFIREEYFDFFSVFYRFADTIPNRAFHERLEKHGHGSGAIRRIKSILRDYPEVLEAWYRFKDEYEQEKVKAWLKSMGLI